MREEKTDAKREENKSDEVQKGRREVQEGRVAMERGKGRGSKEILIFRICGDEKRRVGGACERQGEKSRSSNEASVGNRKEKVRG